MVRQALLGTELVKLTAFKTALDSQLRLKALFTQWDADSSGFLEVKELNRVVALWNGEDWAGMDEAARAEQADNFLSLYDDHGEADSKLDFKEMTEYLLEEAKSFAEEGAPLNAADLHAVIGKFEELVGVPEGGKAAEFALSALLAEAFAAADANNDDLLDAAEFAVRFSRRTATPPRAPPHTRRAAELTGGDTGAQVFLAAVGTAAELTFSEGEAAALLAHLAGLPPPPTVRGAGRPPPDHTDHTTAAEHLAGACRTHGVAAPSSARRLADIHRPSRRATRRCASE